MEEVDKTESFKEMSSNSFGRDSFGIKSSTSEKFEFSSFEIKAEIQRKSQILEENYDDDDEDEEIIVFTIVSKVKNNTFTWKIFKTNDQIRSSFNLIRKELKKKHLLNSDIKRKCKTVKHFSNPEIKNHLQDIATYYFNFISDETVRRTLALRESLGISATSFNVINEGVKPIEGFAFKEAEPRTCFRTTLRIFCYWMEFLFCKQWNKRWLVLRNDMICYLNTSNTLVGKNVYWFDEAISVTKRGSKILLIESPPRKLVLKFNSKFETELWYQEIMKKINAIQDEMSNNKYNSFTTQKDHCYARWFIDGEDYFRALCERLLRARESVFITDWWMSPEIFLKRPVHLNDFINLGGKNDNHHITKKNPEKLTRLMDVLNFIAHKGVKVYILVYHEVSLALSLNSKHTKTTLNSLHENIRVTRHPKATLEFLWSHHEKLVVIDQRIAFVGGLDLCWGRFDHHSHPITEPENDDHVYDFPGIDYSNARINDFANVDNYLRESVSRRKCRMPWHDVHSMLEGPVVADVSRHFVERWNHARFENRNFGLVGVRQAQQDDDDEDFNALRGEESENNLKNNNELRQTKTIDSNRLDTLRSNDNLLENIQVDLKSNYDSDGEEKHDHQPKTTLRSERRKRTDIATRIKRSLPFFGSQVSEHDKDLPMANTYQEREKKSTSPFRKDLNNSELTINRPRKSVIKQAFVDGYQKMKKKIKNMKINHIKKTETKLVTHFRLGDKTSHERDFKCQVLRSCSFWSIGKNRTEHSILQGYYNLIDNSKHYIYIENQFFISKSFSEDERLSSPNSSSISTLIDNEIALHIRSRIENAFYNGENFKVYICIPLLPGFDGEIESSPTVSVILKYTYGTISRNFGLSLIEKLYEKMGSEVDNYIVFFSLRNHSVLDGVPVTELIYIHSKLMIVDDEKVLIGSANINDRSMKGNRDSEFAVIIEEAKNEESIMNHEEKMVSKFAKSFRTHLMAEHLGISPESEVLNDPVSDELFSLVRNRANSNSMIYRKIFDCYPDDKFNNFESLRNRKKFTTREEIEELKKTYEENKNNIIGHIVHFPYDFLKDQTLGRDIFCKENLVPEKNFT